MSKEEAGVLLSKLRPREVESLTRELMRLGSVESEDVDGVMNEFHSLMTAQHFIGRGGVDFAREILAAGLGEDKAEGILSRLNVVYTEVPFASLRNADVRQLVTFLKDEHPQIIALVLAHLTAAQSAEVLSGFAPEQQAEVAHRIATMDRTSPEMVRLVEEELGRRMGSLLAHQDMTTVGGVETLVEIINRSPRPTERSILEWLDNTDPELAEQVRSQMFVFEDIVTIDDRSLQQVLREVEANDLATALKGVRPDVRDKVVRNLSERAAENLNEEIELLGPVRTRTVEEAQAKVVSIIRTLEEQGVLTLTRGQDDEFVCVRESCSAAAAARAGHPVPRRRVRCQHPPAGPQPAPAAAARRSRNGGRRSAGPRTCRWPAAGRRPSGSATSTPRSWSGCAQHAHAEGFAAGHAEGMAAAAAVVAEAERAAAERLADVQARWERRVASADRRARRRGRAARRGRPCRSPTTSARRSSGRSSRWSRTCSAASSRWPTPPCWTPSAARWPSCPADAPAVVRRAPRRPRPRSRPRRSPSCPTPCRVVGDPDVERAGAVAETGPRRIDAQLDGRPRAGPGGPHLVTHPQRPADPGPRRGPARR